MLHDSEDVLHPLELKFFNYLLPRKDLIQIPVLSLPRDWNEWVACTYMDEFAEWHGKDLVVRESMANFVPSAGVGTCFSVHALQLLAADTDNQPFNTESLTEDYDIGERLARRGLKSVFCRFPVEYTVRQTILLGYAGERNQTSRHSALRARVFSQHLPHGLSPKGALDARHRPSGVAAVRLAGLVRQSLPAVPRSQGRRHLLRADRGLRA